MSDERAQTIARLAEEATRATRRHLYDGTFEAHLAKMEVFADGKAVTAAAEQCAQAESDAREIIAAVYDSVAAITLREAAAEYRTSLCVLRHNGANIEREPADWMDDRALDLERKQARRG